MHVRWVEVLAFRAYASLSFAPDPGLNLVTGRNGQGKTSLLEAVGVLLTGRSFRTPRLSECVAWGAAEAQVAGEVADGARLWPVRLTLTSQGAVTGGRAPGRGDWAVTFAADDLGLVAGGPQGRRGYLDGFAARLAPAHAEVCRRYRGVLHHRARLLARVGDRTTDAEALLEPWDEQAATLGAEIVHRRLEALALLERVVGVTWEALTGDGREVRLSYEAVVPPAGDRAETAGRLRAALRAGRGLERLRAETLAGPHRDDVAVRLGGRDARRFGSRGEQRLLALSLRLAEGAAVRQRRGLVPVFLLDDVLSELDAAAARRVLAWLAEQGQVLLSVADAGAWTPGAGAVWTVQDGAVEAALVAAGSR